MLGTLAAGLMAGANMAGGQSGSSNSSSLGFGGSVGSSVNDSINQGENWANSNQYSDAFGSAEAYGQSNGYGYQNSESENWSNNSSWDYVYGSAASAKDIQRAAEANKMQDYFNRQQQAYNSKEAQLARDYETMMSNTSYQRAVADLKAAGLNPILAAGNMGASTPVAAVATSGLASANKAQTFADSEGGSKGKSWGYSSSKGENWNESYNTSSSRNESHSKGSSNSYGYNKGSSHGESNNKSYEYSSSKSQSQNTNNLLKFLGGVGDLFNGLSSGQKTGKGWDGYDNPTVMN